MSLFKEYIDNFNLNNFEDLYENLSKISNLSIRYDENLYLLKYNRRNPDFEEDFKKYPFLRECRSIILEKETNKMVSQSLLFKDEYDLFIENVSWEDCVIEESIDGTLINLYYYNDKWNISTRGTLDANCFWNSEKSFLSLFTQTAEIQDLNYDLLNKEFCYSFVLCHPECRNITKYNKPSIIHILSRNMTNLQESDEEIGIKKPNILKILNLNKLNLNSYDEILESLSFLDYQIEGYMLYSRDRKHRCKLKSKKHLEIALIKGNHPFIEKRLIEIKDTNNFLHYFPEYNDINKKINDVFSIITDTIYNYYIKTKIRKEYIDIPILYRRSIYEIHGIYLKKLSEYEEGSRPIIRKTDISEWIYTQDLNYKYYLYRSFGKLDDVDKILDN